MHPMLPTSDYVELFHEFSRASQDWRAAAERCEPGPRRSRRIGAAIGTSVRDLVRALRRMARPAV